MKRPYFEALTGTNGIWELIIKFEGIMYRPLGFQGPNPGEFTFLLGATKTGRKPTRWDPANAPELAQRRMDAVKTNRKLIDAYRFDSPAAH